MYRLVLCLVLISCGRVSDDSPAVDGGPGGGDGDGGGTPVMLTVSVTGDGAITSDPAGIECGETCTATFSSGTEVVLTAEPDETTGLYGWAGECSGFDPTCTITLSSDGEVGAEFAAHGKSRWVEQLVFDDISFDGHVVIDADGNPITAMVGDDGGGSDLVVTKFDKGTGEALWDTVVDTPAGEYFGGLAVDDSGDVYAAITVLNDGSSFMIGNTSVTGDFVGNIVVMKLAADTGAIGWVQQWGGTGQDRPHAVAVAGNDLFVGGETSSTSSSFGDKTITGSATFLVKASTADGSVILAKQLPSNVEINTIAINGLHVAAGGDFAGDPVIETGCSLNSTGVGNDGFVADFLVTNLECQWVQDFGSNTDSENSSTLALAPIPGGGWAATGSFQGNVLWAPSGSSLGSEGGFDIFAVRYAANGNHEWSYRYGGTGFDVGYGIATTPAGNVILAARFDGDVSFGIHDLSGNDDTVVTRLSTGNAPINEWAVALGGDETDHPVGVTVDANGNAYVLSYFQGMTDVDGTPMSAVSYNYWLAALVP